MFLPNPGLRGSALPRKTLCLTYDDGPGFTAGAGRGPRTDELGRYLFQQGIQATFFVIGERAAACPDALAQLTRWGHLVANHTFAHCELPALLPDGEEVVRQVWDCHRVLGAGAAADRGSLLLRPPYGAWSEEVARILDADARTRRYTGPVFWDVNGNDWQFWRDGASAQACADHYFARLEQVGSGIVLMHDSSAEEELARVNDTYEMTRSLIPRLVANGYRFVRLDAVPQVRAALEAPLDAREAP